MKQLAFYALRLLFGLAWLAVSLGWGRRKAELWRRANVVVCWHLFGEK